MLVREHRHVKLNGSAIDLGSAIYTTACEMDQDRRLGFCWLYLVDITIDMGAPTTMTFKIQWAKMKARVFFQPDSFEVHRFEELLLPIFGFYIKANDTKKLLQPTAKQRASADRLLWMAVDQLTLKCYRK